MRQYCINWIDNSNLVTMKAILSFIFILLTQTFTLIAQEDIYWLTWQEAMVANEKKPKKIFIDIYTDWCGWCKRMDQTTFKNSEIVSYMNEHYYAIKMDAEMKDSITFNDHLFINPKPNARRSTHVLAASLLDNQMSYPSFVIMNEEIVRLNILKGYQQADGLKPILQYFVEDAHLTTPWTQYLEEYNKEKETNK